MRRGVFVVVPKKRQRLFFSRGSLLRFFFSCCCVVTLSTEESGTSGTGFDVKYRIMLESRCGRKEGVLVLYSLGWWGS